MSREEFLEDVERREHTDPDDDDADVLALDVCHKLRLLACRRSSAAVMAVRVRASQTRSASRTVLATSDARAVSIGDGPPGVRRISTKCRGLRTSINSGSVISTGAPRTSRDASRSIAAKPGASPAAHNALSRPAIACAFLNGTPCSRTR